MKDYIAERVVDVANFIISNKVTVRYTAKVFHISKSTVHKDVAERLKEIDRDLYNEVRKVLDVNLLERHIRGGIATKNKYKKDEE